MKILLVRNDNIGDVILTTPLFEAIKKKYPDCYLSVLCAGYSKEPLIEHPFIDKLYVYEKSKHHAGILNKIKCWINQIKTMLQVRKECFDYAIGIRGSFSRSNADLVLFSGAKLKIVRLPSKQKHKLGFDFFIDEPNNKHEVLRSFDCLKPLDVFSQNEKPSIFIPQNINESVMQAIKNLNCTLNQYIILHITARIEPDKWDTKKWIELVQYLSNNHNVIITAAPNSTEAIEVNNWCKTSNNCYFLETPSLKFLASAIKYAKLFITVNGGAMHLGAAMQTPTLALLGDFIINEWHPYGCKYKLIQKDSFFCNDITTQDVISGFEKFILEI